MLKESPLFSYSLLYIAGIAVGEAIALPTLFFVIATLCTTLLSITLYLVTQKSRKKWLNFTLHISLFFTLFIAGIWNISQSPYSKSNLEINSTHLPEGENFIVEATSSASIGSNSSSIIFNFLDSPNCIILYCKDHSRFRAVEKGDRFKANLNLYQLKRGEAEYEGYHNYLKSKRCYHYAFIDGEELVKIESTTSLYLSIVKRVKKSVVQRVLELSNGEEWGPLFIAIISGDKSRLKRESVDAFRAAGTLHLMAVSGLHIGFLYLFITTLSALLGSSQLAKVVRAILVLSAVWFYASLSALSPSAVRASIMVTLLTLSHFNLGEYKLLNVVSGSALLMTLLEPHLIYDIGFLLSFGALLSIVFIAPYFNKLFRKSFFNRRGHPIGGLIDRVYSYLASLVALSISIQIGIAPLLLLTFNTFPTYFLISNMLMISLTAVVVNLGATAALCSPFKALSTTLFKWVGWLTTLLYKIAIKIESLPFSQLHFSFDSTKKRVIVWLLYLTTISVILCREAKIERNLRVEGDHFS